MKRSQATQRRPLSEPSYKRLVDDGLPKIAVGKLRQFGLHGLGKIFGIKRNHDVTEQLLPCFA